MTSKDDEEKTLNPPDLGEAKSCNKKTAPKTSKVKGQLTNLGRQTHEAIEFFGRHPFVTGLLAILSVIGLLFPILGYQLDRKDAESTTAQVQIVEEKIDVLTQSQSKKREPLDIEGRWNSKKAWTKVFEELDLRAKSHPKPFCGGNCVRRVMLK